MACNVLYKHATLQSFMPRFLRTIHDLERYPSMRRYLILTLATLALALAAPSAFATKVIFDPPSGVGPPAGSDCTLASGVLNNFTPCNVNQINTPYDVAFVNCSTLSGLVPAAQGWCLFMTNVTGTTLSTFHFQFAVPSGGSLDGTDQLVCGSQPLGFATDNCPDGVTVSADQLLDISFFATIPNNTNFYLITDFVNTPGTATVTVSVPEPGQLGLFGLGLLALGLGYGWRKRQQARNDQAA